MLSTHSPIFTSLAGKIVRSLPVLKNHRMKRALGPTPCAKSFNCFASFDLCSSSTANSEPSSENSSPHAIAESDSTCCVGELTNEAEEPVLVVSACACFTYRASSTGVAASQSFAVLSQLAVRIRAPSGLNPAASGKLIGSFEHQDTAWGRLRFHSISCPCRDEHQGTHNLRPSFAGMLTLP